jgi:uncharacterized protein with HEPN domain
MQRDIVYLEDIVLAADAIAGFIEDRNLDYLVSSRLLQSALAYQFTIIGEAVARVSKELRDRHPEIPWTLIKGLRNVIVHEYRGVNWEEVWGVATNRVPVLRFQIAEAFKVEFPDDTLGS